MWKNLAEWFGALLITATMAVSVYGAAEWIEKKSEAIPVVAADGAYTVVIDAGHGGADGGAVGNNTGVLEAGLNLSVARMIENLLRANHVNVIMTRTDENALAPDKAKDMQQRKVILNGEGVDLAVSIHMNHFTDSSISGAMAYYMAGSGEGQKIAQQVIDSVCDAIAKNRRLANPGDYFVLRECSCPAVLVECGFLSNAEDEKLLQDSDYQKKLAEAIVKGILKYKEIS